MVVLAGTGHREIPYMPALEQQVAKAFRDSGCKMYIQGCAAGFDLNSARVAIEMGIAVLSAKPWTTHKPRVADKELYKFVIENSWDVYPVTEAEEYPGRWVYDIRNKWMIDECDRLVAWFDGRESGGTWNAIQYAKQTDKKIRNIYVPF